MKALLAVFLGRNLEFVRDRSSMAWNVMFPVLLIIGLAIMFSGDPKPQYKIGVLGDLTEVSRQFAELHSMPYIQWIAMTDQEQAIQKIARHQIDLLLDVSNGLYWINTTSPSGAIMERVLWSAGSNAENRQVVTAKEISYVEWVMPGVLAMNIMFSCLIGVGYVIVRYRKSGFLRRLKATPLTAPQFLLAQLLSRLFLVQVMTVTIFVGVILLLDIVVRGSWLLLLVISLLGSACMISIGLLIAARTRSEEWAGGLLNMISWPMMMMAGVWFSLEGVNDFVRQIAYWLPLTHFVDAARSVMTEGASLMAVSDHLLFLGFCTVLFLLIGSALFKWE